MWTRNAIWRPILPIKDALNSLRSGKFVTNRKNILHFDDINECHAAMGFEGRTDLPAFHIYTLEETYPTTRRIMPPYTFRFYCITLFEKAGDARLEINAELRGPLTDSIAFQSPGHVVAWVRAENQQGFIIYFQPEFLAYLPVPLLDEFPFFKPTESNMLPLELETKTRMHRHCHELIQTYKMAHPYRVQMLQASLVTLLYDCKGVFDNYQSAANTVTPSLALITRFQQLLEQHYLTEQRPSSYAGLLGVSPSYLSQIVSETLGRTIRELIADRLLLEAKKLLRYSNLNVAEIADYLGFSEQTHFGRFFKRHAGLTPGKFRRSEITITPGHY